MLSTTILIGHGSSISAVVSPTTPMTANVSAFQCGRSRSTILSALGEGGDFGVVTGAAGGSMGFTKIVDRAQCRRRGNHRGREGERLTR